MEIYYDCNQFTCFIKRLCDYGVCASRKFYKEKKVKNDKVCQG